MDLTSLSYTLLEEAITKGTITLENRVIKLTGSQIITCMRYILERKVSTTSIENEIDIPVEMFSLGHRAYICRACHMWKGCEEFVVTSIDPSGQICNECKREVNELVTP